MTSSNITASSYLERACTRCDGAHTPRSALSLMWRIYKHVYYIMLVNFTFRKDIYAHPPAVRGVSIYRGMRGASQISDRSIKFPLMVLVVIWRWCGENSIEYMYGNYLRATSGARLVINGISMHFVLIHWNMSSVDYIICNDLWFVFVTKVRRVWYNIFRNVFD